MTLTHPGAARIAVGIVSKTVCTIASNTLGIGYRVETGHYSNKPARLGGCSTAVTQAHAWTLIPVGLGLIGLTLKRRKPSTFLASQD